MKQPPLANTYSPSAEIVTPERRLWQRVLISAARDIQTRSGRQTDGLIYMSESWIRSRDFAEVCDLAGVNAEVARRRFNEMITR
jgi:hypothetical protein